MYIVKKSFSNTPQGTTDTTKYRGGDLIADFNTWPEHAQRHLVNGGYVAPAIAALQPIAKPVENDSVAVTDEAASPGRATAQPAIKKRFGRKK